MASSARKVVILNLYKQLLRESEKFNNYNYKFYALRRIRDAFKSSRNETDLAKLDNFQKLAEDNLDMIRRQVVIGGFFKAPPSVVEAKH